MARRPNDPCIDCEAVVTKEALALNPSGLWCIKCEHARRERIDQQMAQIAESFDPPKEST